MKRISILFILLVTVLLISKAQNKDWEKPCLSPDGTMVYEYSKSAYLEIPVILVSREGVQLPPNEKFTVAPWWFNYNPHIIKSHWETYGKEVCAILDELKIAKRSLRVNLFYSLGSGKLIAMTLSVDDSIAHQLNQLPLKEIFSIYESIDTTQFITINDHEPCEEDNMFVFISTICR